jgi:hypothetical protein
MGPWFLLVVMVGALLRPMVDGADDPAYGTYAWPVRGPVIRGFEPPSDPFGPGHRGIDIAAAFGTDLIAAEGGVVAFAGWIGGSLFASIDHPDGVRSTYSWLSAIEVSEGEAVDREQVIGSTGRGHADGATPHLHFGTRIGATYIDPMLMLKRGSVVGLIHLAPLTPSPGPEPGGPGRHPLPGPGLGPHPRLRKTGPTYNERSWTPTIEARAYARGPPARTTIGSGVRFAR